MASNNEGNRVKLKLVVEEIPACKKHQPRQAVVEMDVPYSSVSQVLGEATNRAMAQLKRKSA